MSAPFTVDVELLSDVIDRMAAFERTLEERLEEVEARVGRLHGTWSGAAAVEHRRAHQEWVRGARQMHVAIVALRRFGATAHANYTAAVVANRGMWG